ncbi:MAG: hypothetical protein WD360_00345 [Nitriliruptoraceae bacterium]
MPSPSAPRDRRSQKPRPRPDQQAERSGLSVPGGAKEPLGRDRARLSKSAPPRVSSTNKTPPRPTFPPDETPQLSRGILREIDRIVGPGDRAHDIALALSIGSAAIEDDLIEVARNYLSWARFHAPKVPPIREAYGVALYLDEAYELAVTELQAYKRLTGRNDQNHLIADCFRALGKPLDKIVEMARTAFEDDRVPRDRQAEAVIVWASALADAEDLASARAVLRRYFDAKPGKNSGDGAPDLRVRVVAAALAERANDTRDRDEHRARIVAMDASYFDDEASERF